MFFLKRISIFFRSPVIVLKDIRKCDLEALLEYMYVGEVSVKQTQIEHLMKAAECLCIKGLAVPDEIPSNNRSGTWKNDPTSARVNGRSTDCDSPSPTKKRRRKNSEGEKISNSNIKVGDEPADQKEFICDHNTSENDAGMMHAAHIKVEIDPDTISRTDQEYDQPESESFTKTEPGPSGLQWVSGKFIL